VENAARQPEAPIAPLPNQNQVDAVGQRSAAAIAKGVFDRHTKGLQAMRQAHLTWELFLLHIDGSGDSQWASILNGQRVEIPRLISEYRKTENLLRLVVDNAVAHHTTMPLHYFVEAAADRKSREHALIDTLWANHLANDQDFNGLTAEALYLAMPCGFSPIHAYWREDVARDHFEPAGYGTAGNGLGVAPGMIDCFVGNPFDHVFGRAARRGSFGWSSYGRLIPADLFRQQFGHVPGVMGLQGSTRIPSAALYQRIARDWQLGGLGMHGSPVITHRRDDGEEMLTVICLEIAPGYDSEYPEGRLQIIAVPGDVDTRRGAGTGGNALLVADQPLPASDFSFSIFYSHHRGDDVHGKPWVEDMDQLQVDLNIALSKRWEAVNKMLEAPIVAPGGAISDDMAELGGYNLMEIEPSLANWRPRVVEFPSYVLPALDNEIKERRSAIYTAGGFQAASRGEAPGSRMAYRAIVALQEADRSVHGPVNMRYRRSATDLMRRCWRQMKAYGDVPWLVNIAGDEFSYLVEPYIDNTKLSDEPPRYKLVNAFGSSPELHAQEVIQLAQTRGADGQPFLTTAEARRQYPNQRVFDDRSNPSAVAKRRARTIAAQLHVLSKRYREQTGLEENDPTHPWVQYAGQQIFDYTRTRYPVLRDDDLNANIAALSEITQDETSDPIARVAAVMRQEVYYQWQAQMAMQMSPQPGGAAPPQQQGASGAPQQAQDPMGREAVAAETQAGGTGGMTLDQMG
jgi:hypothetical protein